MLSIYTGTELHGIDITMRTAATGLCTANLSPTQIVYARSRCTVGPTLVILAQQIFRGIRCCILQYWNFYDSTRAHPAVLLLDLQQYQCNEVQGTLTWA